MTHSPYTAETRLRLSPSRIVVVCTLLAGLFGGTAVAQDSGISGDLERTAKASPQEKLSYASDAAEELRDNLKSVRSWLQEQLNAKGRYRAGGTTAAL